MKNSLFLFIVLYGHILGVLVLFDQTFAVTDEVLGSWSLVCSKSCAISQAAAMDPDGRNVVMGVTVYFLPGRPIANIDIRINPNAMPKAGIGIKVDEYPSFKIAMSVCDKRVCLARGYLDEPLLGQLKAGKVAKIAFLLNNSRQLTYPLSLNGFAQAYGELQRKRRA